MSNLNEIETLTKEFSEASDSLTLLKKELGSEIETAKSKYFKKIKDLAEVVVLKKSELEQAIISGRHLFIKPKTLVISGVKVGFQKTKDKIVWDDEEHVAYLIEKVMGKGTAEMLVKTEKKPIKESLMKLGEDELSKIACRIEKGEDKVVIKTVDSEIDKFVNSLMKEPELI
ncbi:MAG: hypothetical protein L0Y79_12125 [Chlorobi bacterium]|nr:hypothetical protein [Chlorobiota bacterium]MCI0715675.1 hypothetical protein [Chlorobiota bacterium]